MLPETGCLKKVCFHPCHRFRMGQWQITLRLFFLSIQNTARHLQLVPGKNGDEKLCGRKKTQRKSALPMQISQVVMFSLCLDISNKSKFVHNLKIPVFICVCLLSLYYSLWFYQFSMSVYFIFPQQVIFVSGMGCFVSAKFSLSLCVSLSILLEASKLPHFLL